MSTNYFDPNHMFSVAGKSILISGATGTLGTATALGLAKGGARLTLADNNAEGLEKLANQVRSLGAQVAVVPFWPDTEEHAKAMVDTAIEHFSEINGTLITNGTNYVADIVDMPVDSWQKVMDANLRGPWLACQAVGRQMVAQGKGGSVVVLSSTRGKLGHPAGYTAYCIAAWGFFLFYCSCNIGYWYHVFNVDW